MGSSNLKHTASTPHPHVLAYALLLASAETLEQPKHTAKYLPIKPKPTGPTDLPQTLVGATLPVLMMEAIL